MKILHSLAAGLLSATSVLARRVAFPLLFLGAGLVLVQPCAGASGVFDNTGSLATARFLTRRRCCPTARCSSQEDLTAAPMLSRARSCTIQRAGPGRRPAASPPHALITRRRCCPTARCSSQEVGNGGALSRARNCTIRRAGPGRRPAASPPHAMLTRRRCCPTARCSSQEEVDSGTGFASAELYDPASGTWTATGSLGTARRGHTATLLPNGKVLVAGGDDSSNALASAELYDPASGTWTATGSLATARYGHTATLLPNGKVLVAGGRAPASAAFSRARNCTIRRAGPGRRPAASPPHAVITRRRCCPTARCSSQEVLTPTAFASAELYDPASGTWTATGSLGTARDVHTATLLPNGQVLVAGGGNERLSRARNSTRSYPPPPNAAAPGNHAELLRHTDPTPTPQHLLPGRRRLETFRLGYK